jgi:hypothetical protein
MTGFAAPDFSRWGVFDNGVNGSGPFRIVTNGIQVEKSAKGATPSPGQRSGGVSENSEIRPQAPRSGVRMSVDGPE